MASAPAAANRRRGQQTFVLVASVAFLTLAFVFFGYAVVAGVPQVTTAVATSTVTGAGSPFTKGQLVTGADAVREYSFASHDADALYGVIAEMNRAQGTPYADPSELAAAPERYTVTAEQLAHLDDVYDVSSRLFTPLLGVAVLAVFLLMTGFRMFGVRLFARSLAWSGTIALGVIAVLGLWAAFGFDSLFAGMHGLLFADGTWTFSADSLLITMLPAPFWAAMALTWAGASALVSAVSLAGGLVMLRRHGPAASEPRKAAEPAPASDPAPAPKTP